MSFLKELIDKKSILKNTTTVITQADGKRYVEDARAGKLSLDGARSFGFVVDDAPDDVPAEVVPNLFIGSQDCVDTNVLKQYGIRHVLSVGVFIDLRDSGIDSEYIACLDLPETNLIPVLECANLYIKNVLKNNEPILVHCNAGVSRASAVVLGFLILETSMTFADAYALLKSKRPCIQPNVGFVKQLKLLNK